MHYLFQQQIYINEPSNSRVNDIITVDKLLVALSLITLTTH